MGNTRTCTHIRATGVRCGSPALRDEQFCYFHQRMHRGVPTPPQARLHAVANLEDEESIQLALMEVVNALMRNTIDLQRATLILRALHIAVKNAGRVKFPLHANSMVKQVPDFAEPKVDRRDAPISESEIPFEAALPPETPTARGARTRTYCGESYADMTAHYYGYPNAAAHAAAKARGGADAFVRTGEATVPQPAAPLPPPSPLSNATDRAASTKNSEPHRKPPLNVKPTTKEQKSRAQTASS